MPHDHVHGREVEMRRLTNAVRVVNELLVNHLANGEKTTALALEVSAVNNDLVPFMRPLDQRFAAMGPDRNPADIFPFDIMLGPYNPLGPAIEVDHDGEEAIGRVVFSKAYEGPPGCCHGGVIAASFDQVFNVANIMADAAGFTAELSIDYRRPTRLGVSTTFRARVDSTEGRKVSTVGTCEQDGEVTCEATGLFVSIDSGD